MLNKAFLKDFGWYFLGSLGPLLIGFIKTPVFTRHFDKEAYGYLGLVSITFSYLGIVLFSWIASCLWRYFSRYKQEGSLKSLYSNLSLIYISASFVLALVSITWYSFAENDLVKDLILFSFFQLLFNQCFLVYMVVIRLQGKAAFYTIIQTIRAILGLGTALIFVFILDANISALVSSLIVVDALALLFFALVNPAEIKLNFSLRDKTIIKELLTYGSAGLIINLGFLIIASSDRYIIAWLDGLGQVGIYDQVYKISQLSIASLVVIYFNTLNPTLLKELELNFKSSYKLIQKYISSFIIFGLPIVCYLSIISKDLATIFLGSQFREGYIIMPFIFIAAYLHGLSNFYELRYKFSNKLKSLTFIIIAIALLNIVLNLVFVKLFNYKWAAVTTAVCYLILVWVFHILDKELLRYSSQQKNILIKICLFLALQGAIYLFLDNKFDLNLLIKVLLLVFFTATYFIIFRKQFRTTDLPINF